jgi:hypothetical protein
MTYDSCDLPSPESQFRVKKQVWLEDSRQRHKHARIITSRSRKASRDRAVYGFAVGKSAPLFAKTSELCSVRREEQSTNNVFFPRMAKKEKRRGAFGLVWIIWASKFLWLLHAEGQLM